jgi:hypothetical protein
VRGYSLLVAYAWIFLIAALLSAAGLTMMVELFGSATDWSRFLPICQHEVRWSIGPALICVYLNHYMDRQIDHSRPDIGESGDSPFRRVVYALLFTVLVILAALPFESTISAIPGGSWDVSKLRFAAMGTIFCVTFSLALVAQFALKKPRNSGGAPKDSWPIASVPPGGPATPVSVRMRRIAGRVGRMSKIVPRMQRKL